MYEWLSGSVMLLGIWLVIFAARPHIRKEMLQVSLLTMLFGLTEPLFVPEYWNPPSLFDLAAKTGFDIESFIFSFAVGGIGAVLYESLAGGRHKKISEKEMRSGRHRFHLLAMASPALVFILLELVTGLNPIYSASMAMLAGGLATALCRPDLKREIAVGGALFLGIYSAFFLFFNLLYPDFVQAAWNLRAVSGILALGIPVEELAFAFTFGMMWAGLYEHALWYRIIGK